MNTMSLRILALLPVLAALALPAGCSTERVEEAPPPVPPAGPIQGAWHAAPTWELVGDVGARPRPIVLISLDTVRADSMSLYGGRAVTPSIEAVAGQGALFAAAMTHFPETCLSHWSMMTGVLPVAHGNAPGQRGSRYTGPTLAEISARHGYATGAFIGGWTLADDVCGIGRGFGLFDDQHEFAEANPSLPATEVTARAVQWIEGQQGPFFAFVHYFDAHSPYTPAPPWDTAYDPTYTGSMDGSSSSLDPYRSGLEEPEPRDVEHVRALYEGEISQLDEALAPLLQALPADAVVAITADHGESFEHGYYFNHRDGLWDSVLRVPLVIRAPGVPAGAQVDDLVALSDLAPTLLALAGLPGDARMQGRSLVPLATELAATGRDEVFAVTDPWRPPSQFAVRTPHTKLIERDAGVQVYDLRADPREERASDHVPEALEGAASRYRLAVDSLAPHMVEPPSPTPLSGSEIRRLEALGYVEPGVGARPDERVHMPIPADMPIWEQDIHGFVDNPGWYGEASWEDVRMRVAQHQAVAGRDMARIRALGGDLASAADTQAETAALLDAGPVSSPRLAGRVTRLLRDAALRDAEVYRALALGQAPQTEVTPGLYALRIEYWALAIEAREGGDLSGGIADLRRRVAAVREATTALDLDAFGSFEQRHDLRVLLWEAYLDSLDPLGVEERWGYWTVGESRRQARLLEMALTALEGGSPLLHGDLTGAAPDLSHTDPIWWPTSLAEAFHSPDQIADFTAEGLGALPTGDSLVDVAGQPGPRAIGSYSRLGLDDAEHRAWLDARARELDRLRDLDPARIPAALTEMTGHLDGYGHTSRYYNIKQVRNEGVRQLARARRADLALDVLRTNYPLHHQDWACPNREGILRAIEGRLAFEAGRTDEALSLLRASLDASAAFLGDVDRAERGGR